LAGARGIEPRS